MAGLLYPLQPAQMLPLPTLENPQGAASYKGEILPVVEESGLVTACAPRSYIHSGVKLMHPVVHLHIINRKGELYLQKRSPKKDLYPGRWDTAVGGHVAYGESLLEALYRESSEELGLYDFNPVFIKDYVYESDTEKELVNVYACVGYFKISPDGEEVSEGRFWTEKEIGDSFEKSIFTPNFESEYPMVRKDLEALL